MWPGSIITEIPYIREWCGFYFDWLGILTKYVKICSEYGRCLEMNDSKNCCNWHGDRRVRMEVREGRTSTKVTYDHNDYNCYNLALSEVEYVH